MSTMSAPETVEKFEIFRAELIKKIKAATATYRRKWNKSLQTPPESNPLGHAYNKFVEEANICETAQTALVELLEVVTGKKMVVPEKKDGSLFLDMTNLVAISLLTKKNEDDPAPSKLTWVGVSLTGNDPDTITEVELRDGTTQESDIDAYQNSHEETTRVANAAEIDLWAKEYLVLETVNEKKYKALQSLWNSWLVLGPC